MTTIDKKELDAARQELAEEKKSRKVGFAEEMGIRMKPYLQQAANDAAFGAAEWLDKYLKDITNGKDADGIGKSINEIREDLNSFIADQTEANERFQEYLEDIDETVGGELSEEESEAEKKEKQAEDDEELMEVLTQGKVLDPTNNRLGKKDEEDKKKRNDENRKDRGKLMDYIHDAILLLVMGARRLLNNVWNGPIGEVIGIKSWLPKIADKVAVAIDWCAKIAKRVEEIYHEITDNPIYQRLFGNDEEIYYLQKKIEESGAVDEDDLKKIKKKYVRGHNRKSWEIAVERWRKGIPAKRPSSVGGDVETVDATASYGASVPEVVNVPASAIPMDNSMSYGDDMDEFNTPEVPLDSNVSEEPIGEVEDGAPSNSGTTIVNNVINHSSRNYYNSKNEPTRG